MEEGSGDGHHQCCGYAFARHVANTEKEAIVADQEIKQVAANTLGRLHHTVDVDVATLRIRRELIGNHMHLNKRGGGHLTLEDGFLGRRALHLFHIGRQ